MKIFWKIYLVVFLLFVLVMGTGIYALSKQRIAEAQDSISVEYQTIGSLITGDIRRGRLESKWPFESLNQLSQRSDFIFWWVVREDGVIHLADDVKIIGHETSEYFSEPHDITKSGHVAIDTSQNVGVFTQQFMLGKDPWSFWIGFSTEKISRATSQILLSSAVILGIGLIILGVGLYAYIRHSLRPIQLLAESTQKIQQGDLDVSITIQADDELGNLAHCFNRMVKHLKHSTVSIDDLRAIFLAAPIGMMLVNSKLLITRANHVCGEMIGRRPEDIEGLPYRVGFGCGELNNTNDASTQNPLCQNCKIRKAIAEAFQSGNTAHNIEQEFHCQIGTVSTTHWLEVSVEPVTLHGEPFVVVAINNISQRKRDEQKMKTLNQDLGEAVRLARQAETTKSEFLATMSHEIRTPMNSILGFSELLQAETLTNQQMQFVNMIHRSTKTLLGIINDILDFSKIEAGKLDLEIIDCNTRHLVEEIHALLQPSAAAKNIEFTTSVDPRVPDNIQTDPTRLKQCLINLANNAIKFTEEGRVELRMTSSLGRNGMEWVQIAIEDTGIGIPLEMRDTIFESFKQADQNITRKYGGTGLGLAITNRLTELLGGSIHLDSTEEKGSTFTIELPVHNNDTIHLVTSNEKQEVLANSTALQVQNHFDGHILVAEDHPSNQMLIRILLERAGFTVTLVKDGVAAVEKATHHSYDLLLMDIQMPLMNGMDATRKIREAGITIPIIALTANTMKGDEEKCLVAGCDSFLGKPIVKDALFRMIETHLGRTPSDRTDESTAQATNKTT